MISPMYFFGIISSYNQFNDYEGLSDEEKRYIEYVDECLFHSDEKISYACTKMMILILKSSSLLNTCEEMSIDEVQDEKNIIYSNLNNEEKEIVDSFTYACINILGIYSEESKKERKLKNERK